MHASVGRPSRGGPGPGRKAAAAPQPAQPAAPRDVKTVLAGAAKAMGVDSLKTIQYSGAGTQRRHRAEPDTGGRLAAGQREVVRPGDRLCRSLVADHDRSSAEWQRNDAGSARSARLAVGRAVRRLAHSVRVSQGRDGRQCRRLNRRTVMGIPYTVVTFMVQNKYKVSGYIDDKNMVYKVETWVDNTVLGDMLVEAIYTDYKDYTGAKVPTTIINKQDGRNTLLLIVDEVKPNAAVSIQAPQHGPGSGGAARGHGPDAEDRQRRVLPDGRHPPQRRRGVRGSSRRDRGAAERSALARGHQGNPEVGRQEADPLHHQHASSLRSFRRAADLRARRARPSSRTTSTRRSTRRRCCSPTAPRTLNPDALALEKKKVPTLTIEPVRRQEGPDGQDAYARAAPDQGQPAQRRHPDGVPAGRKDSGGGGSLHAARRPMPRRPRRSARTSRAWLRTSSGSSWTSTRFWRSTDPESRPRPTCTRPPASRFRPARQEISRICARLAQSSIRLSNKDLVAQATQVMISLPGRLGLWLIARVNEVSEHRRIQTARVIYHSLEKKRISCVSPSPRRWGGWVSPRHC